MTEDTSTHGKRPGKITGEEQGMKSAITKVRKSTEPELSHYCWRNLISLLIYAFSDEENYFFHLYHNVKIAKIKRLEVGDLAQVVRALA